MKGENLVTTLFYNGVKKALVAGYNVILDNTFCQLKYINQAIDELNGLASIDYRYFDMPLKTCIERDALRKHPVGEAVIKKMHKDLKILLDVFDFQPKTKRKIRTPDYTKDWDKDLPYVIISDIDGSCCHMDDKRGPFDWHKVGLDRPDVPTIETLKAWKDRKTFRGQSLLLFMVSGRDEVCRPETEEWLKKHGVPFDKLLMRPKGDFRKDSIIKREIYENEIFCKYNVITVFDDRDQVVDLWRSLGLKCIQLEPGQF
jgi:predicted kinase